MNRHKHIVIFIGPPGSGKGSLSQWSVQHLGWAQLSTGDLCRRHIADKTEIGKQIDFFLRSGKLISDALMIDMVEEWMITKLKDIDVLVLDGFPRTLAQAHALDVLLKKDCFKDVCVSVVQLVIDDAVVKQRMMNRLICSNKSCGTVYSNNNDSVRPQVAMKCDRCGSELIVRADDNADSIDHRLEIYHKYVDELLAYYRQDNDISIKMINADKPFDQVVTDFKKIIDLKL